MGCACCGGSSDVAERRYLLSPEELAQKKKTGGVNDWERDLRGEQRFVHQENKAARKIQLKEEKQRYKADVKLQKKQKKITKKKKVSQQEAVDLDAVYNNLIDEERHARVGEVQKSSKDLKKFQKMLDKEEEAKRKEEFKRQKKVMKQKKKANRYNR